MKKPSEEDFRLAKEHAEDMRRLGVQGSTVRVLQYVLAEREVLRDAVSAFRDYWITGKWDAAAVCLALDRFEKFDSGE